MGKILINHISDKELISRIHNSIEKKNKQQTEKPEKRIGKGREHTFLKRRHIQLANRCMKWCSASPIFGKMQTKTTMIYDLTFVRTAFIKKIKDKPSYNHYRKQHGGSSKNDK